ncbi:TetR/AcrR family transcriptional regulator [Sporolactobacillus shoreae]|uniref:TetR/AcrR family transcriptional regulator n=1 Tax=Sporolactobacillus shoreae TaxID=1465501 RepID=A0A4Z0GRX3_9BACL|nr:TetR/AcrR family transcriptional regulator [Sporolactobacillus shoreae]TGA99405.1 TetR/AcrR family transcriptional regulator [Sporolactobacillus shoreae]
MVLLDKFLSLPLEKQNTIVDGALTAFGTNGYKKASVSDIAAAAGISKAMVFHYFGTKKALYLYLIKLCGTTMMDEINEKFDRAVTDFFDRIRLAGDIKLAVIQKHPAILLFLSSVLHENDDEVKQDIRMLLADQNVTSFREKIAFEGVNTSKFKEGVDPKLIVKMLTWMSEGYFNDITGYGDTDLEIFYKEFLDCLVLLKKVCYK